MLSPPSKNVLAYADALDFEVAIFLANGDQAKVGSSATHIADENDVSGADLASPRAAGLGRPCIECRLRFFEQDDLAETSGLCRLGCQIPRDFIEGCRNSENDLALRQVPGTALDALRIQEILP